jgi:hypothetical protein
VNDLPEQQFLTLLGTFAKLQKAIINSVMSVRPSAWNNWFSNGWIFRAFGI